MTRRRIPIALLALVLALAHAALGPVAVDAGEHEGQVTFGGTTFFSSPPCPLNQFPTFESLVPVPRLIDPFEQDLIPMFCQVQAANGDRGVKKAKGTFESELIVRDNETGEIESFPVGSGRFKTDSDGFDSFDFDLPAEIFADGFESGDVSAWSSTRTDFTNKKKGSQVQVVCSLSASRSGN